MKALWLIILFFFGIYSLLNFMSDNKQGTKLIHFPFKAVRIILLFLLMVLTALFFDLSL